MSFICLEVASTRRKTKLLTLRSIHLTSTSCLGDFHSALVLRKTLAWLALSDMFFVPLRHSKHENSALNSLANEIFKSSQVLSNFFEKFHGGSNPSKSSFPSRSIIIISNFLWGKKCKLDVYRLKGTTGYWDYQLLILLLENQIKGSR